MKKHLTLLLVLVLAMTTFTSCDEEEGYAIDPRDLPSQAWDFLDYYYYDVQLVDAYYYGGNGGYYDQAYYRVNLSDGTSVGFDRRGQWYFVYAPWNYGVPYDLVPSRILGFVNYYYQHELVNAITITGYGYDIRLTNGTELSFDIDGNVYD